MGLEEYVKLNENESVIVHYDCNFPTKKEELIQKIGKKRFLLLFEKEYKYKELTEMPITVNGTLYITTRKLYFVRAQGLVFKRRELILDIPLEEIVSTLTQGVIFKDLVVGTEKDGVVHNYTFQGLPAVEAKDKIRQVQSMKLEEINPKQEQTVAIKEIKKEENKPIPVQEQIAKTPAVEPVSKPNEIAFKYCGKCGYKIFSKNNFCAGCGIALNQNAVGNMIQNFAKKTEKKITAAVESKPKLKMIEDALMYKSIYCQNCGKTTKDTETFCVSCGQGKKSLKEIKFCKNCGTQINKGANFCSGCGIKI